MNENDIEFQKNNLDVFGSVENPLEDLLYKLAFESEPLISIFSKKPITEKEYFFSLKTKDNVIDIELKNKISELKKRFKKEDLIKFFSELNFYNKNEEKNFFKEALENFWDEKFVCSAFLLSGCLELMLRNTIDLNKKGKIYYHTRGGQKKYCTLVQLLKKNRKLLTNFFKKEELEWINSYIKWIFSNEGLNLRNKIVHLFEAKILFNKNTNNKLFQVLCIFLYFEKKTIN